MWTIWSSSSSSLLLLPLLLLLICPGVSGFADGPPLTSCVDMEPQAQMGPMGWEGHVDPGQNIWPTFGRTKTPPYYIEIHRDIIHYYPNDIMEVSIVSNQSTGHIMYTGVLMQARKVVCITNETIQVEDVPYGHFVVPAEQHTTLLKTLDCTNQYDSIGHKSPQWKINETMRWQAPGSSIGHLVFKATVVQEEDIYWTEVYSPLIMDPTAPDVATCASNRLSTTVYMNAILLAASLRLVIANVT